MRREADNQGSVRSVVHEVTLGNESDEVIDEDEIVAVHFPPIFWNAVTVGRPAAALAPRALDVRTIGFASTPTFPSVGNASTSEPVTELDKRLTSADESASRTRGKTSVGRSGAIRNSRCA